MQEAYEYRYGQKAEQGIAIRQGDHAAAGSVRHHSCQHILLSGTVG